MSSLTKHIDEKKVAIPKQILTLYKNYIELRNFTAGFKSFNDIIIESAQIKDDSSSNSGHIPEF